MPALNERFPEPSITIDTGIGKINVVVEDNLEKRNEF